MFILQPCSDCIYRNNYSFEEPCETCCDPYQTGWPSYVPITGTPEDEFTPAHPAVGVAREMKDYLEHGSKGKPTPQVMARVADYMLKFAEALGKE